ncbi:germination protein GerAC [Collibacillus ludicampi]|uniref:Germination protein GerAC n=1 Tax=Collibacillus ludicampi TaxID=2771369 RepID=A0AAV4LGM6_9BACL|nr:Ger(x)C family spore germination protein [Collibacillus ludicampi]GIM46935.1 germination protein GerAC [Collibacillus ludicampi]
MRTKRGLLLNLLLILILLCPLLSGCYDRVELEEMAFVVSMGFDKGPGDTIDVTARVAVPRKLTGGGSGGGGGGAGGGEEVGGAKAITIRAHTVEEALNLLNTSVERRVSLIQLSIVVFGEDLARRGILPYIRPLVRSREFRRTIFVSVVKGKAKEAFDANKPILENTVTRYNEDVRQVGRHTGLSTTIMLHDFVTAVESVHEDPYTGVFAVNEDVKVQAEEEKKKNKSKGDGKGGDEGTEGETGGKGAKQESGEKIKIKGQDISFEPGQVKRQGGNPLEFIGMAVFQKDKLVTILDGIDTRMLLSLRGELNRTQAIFANPYSKNDYITVEIKQARPPQFEVIPLKEPLQIRIHLSLEGDLLGEMAGTDFTKEGKADLVEKIVADKVRARILSLLNTLYHKYQADPVGIVNHIRGQFLTMQDLKAYDWREKLKTADIDVDVNFKLRRVGVQLAPPISQ